MNFRLLIFSLLASIIILVVFYFIGMFMAFLVEYFWFLKVFVSCIGLTIIGIGTASIYTMTETLYHNKK